MSREDTFSRFELSVCQNGFPPEKHIEGQLIVNQNCFFDWKVTEVQAIKFVDWSPGCHLILICPFWKHTKSSLFELRYLFNVRL